MKCYRVTICNISIKHSITHILSISSWNYTSDEIYQLFWITDLIAIFHFAVVLKKIRDLFITGAFWQKIVIDTKISRRYCHNIYLQCVKCCVVNAPSPLLRSTGCAVGMADDCFDQPGWCSSGTVK